MKILIQYCHLHVVVWCIHLIFSWDYLHAKNFVKSKATRAQPSSVPTLEVRYEDQLIIGKPGTIDFVLRTNVIPQRINVIASPHIQGAYSVFRPIVTTLDFSKGSAVIGRCSIVPQTQHIILDSLIVEYDTPQESRKIVTLPCTPLTARTHPSAQRIIDQGLTPIVPFGTFTRTIQQDTIVVLEDEKSTITLRISPDLNDSLAQKSIHCFSQPTLTLPPTSGITVLTQEQVFPQEKNGGHFDIHYTVLSGTLGTHHGIIAPQWYLDTKTETLKTLPPIAVTIRVIPRPTQSSSWFDRWLRPLTIITLSTFALLFAYRIVIINKGKLLRSRL